MHLAHLKIFWYSINDTPYSYTLVSARGWITAAKGIWDCEIRLGSLGRFVKVGLINRGLEFPSSMLVNSWCTWGGRGQALLEICLFVVLYLRKIRFEF